MALFQEFAMQTKQRTGSAKALLKCSILTREAAVHFVPLHAKQQPSSMQFPSCNSLEPLPSFPAVTQTLCNTEHPSLSQQVSFLKKSHPYQWVPFQHQSFTPFPPLTTAFPAVYGRDWGGTPQKPHQPENSTPPNKTSCTFMIFFFLCTTITKGTRPTDLPERK